MTIRGKLMRFIGAVATIIICSSISVIAKEVGTITLKSGEVFEQIEYKVNKSYKVITMFDDGRKKKVIFSDIESIVNGDGVNITGLVLGRRYESPRDTWTSSGDSWAPEDSPEFQKARAKKWNTAISFNLSYNLPSGDFYQGITGGAGFGGDIHIAINHQLALRGTISRSGIDFNDNFGFVSSANVTIVSQEYSMKATRVMFGLEFYQSEIRGEKLRSTWYVHTMLGFISHKFSSEIVLQDITTNEIAILVGDDTDSRFTISGGVGFIPMLSPSIGVNLSADLDLVWATVFYSDGSSGAEVAGYVFDINIGLVIFP